MLTYAANVSVKIVGNTQFENCQIKINTRDTNNPKLEKMQTKLEREFFSQIKSLPMIDKMRNEQ